LRHRTGAPAPRSKNRGVLVAACRLQCLLTMEATPVHATRYAPTTRPKNRKAEARDEKRVGARRIGGPDESDMVRACLRDLYARHHRFVWRICWRYVQNRADADDCAHDVLLRAARARPAFRGECADSSWLYRVAVNRCRSVLRQRAEQRAVLERVGLCRADCLWGADRWEPDNDEEDPRRVAAQVLQVLARSGDPGLRRLAVLRFAAGLTQTGIARETGLPRAAVRRHLTRLYESAFDLFRAYARDGIPRSGPP
jgi:RNA polymerase sigma factor (sigma-70 family)